MPKIIGQKTPKNDPIRVFVTKYCYLMLSLGVVFSVLIQISLRHFCLYWFFKGLDKDEFETETSLFF